MPIAQKLEWNVPVLMNPLTVKQFLYEEKEMSSRLLKRLKKDGVIWVNGKPVPFHALLYGEETVTVFLPQTEFPEDIPAWNGPLNVCWEDEHLLIINKPAGVPMFPGRGREEKTLAGAVRNYYEELGVQSSFHAVSRLDKWTSGLVTVAKHAYAHQRLDRFFKEKKGRKTYIGVTKGIWEEKSGMIDAPIARKTDSLIEHEVAPHGKNARTIYQVLEEKSTYSIVRFELLTGRTHQIRVHSSYCAHPLLGDDLYGGPCENMNRQALHAFRLSFIHPVFETKHTVHAELPDDMQML